VTTLSLADWLNFSVASIEAENNVYRIGSWSEINKVRGLDYKSIHVSL